MAHIKAGAQTHARADTHARASSTIGSRKLAHSLNAAQTANITKGYNDGAAYGLGDGFLTNVLERPLPAMPNRGFAFFFVLVGFVDLLLERTAMGDAGRDQGGGGLACVRAR